MDSQFVNFDGRSVHDVLQTLLAASGDPEAIRRLQESINAVDQRAQSSISIVNAAVQQLDSEVDVVANAGAKNKFPNLKIGQSETVNGVTFTVNADGSVTINGRNTATAENKCYITLATAAGGGNIKAGSYLISGVPEGYANKIWVWGSNVVENRTEADKLFTVATDRTAAWGVSVAVGDTQFDNVTVYPMVRDAKITDDTYVPYGKTNAELTEDSGWLTLTSDYVDLYYRKHNGVLYLKLAQPAKQNLSGAITNAFTLPETFRPQQPSYIFFDAANMSARIRFYIAANNGNIDLNAPAQIAQGTQLQGIYAIPI